jgi:UDP-N-acetylmuramate dehydrogenase
MAAVADEVAVLKDQAIPTWFGIGGRAERFAQPESVEGLRRCVGMDPALRVLGDGANLLVDDDGVGELVVTLSAPAFTQVRWGESGMVTAGAGANLPKLITEAVRRGLGGVEGLGGIPASLGGAVRMNAGGAFGQIADAVARVHGVDRAGRSVSLERDEIEFSYRHSGLEGLIITSVELELHEEDPGQLRARLKEVMEYKKKSQPMADRSAGCVFKNPTLHQDLPGIGPRGERVSAGMLIDRAGAKGTRVGGASVSPRHGNFIVTDSGARARDVIELMGVVVARVRESFGVELEREVVVWGRGEAGDFKSKM